MKQIVLTEYQSRLFFGLFQDGQPVEISFYDRTPGFQLGDVFLARVQDIVPGIQAAFVGLTPNQKAYLPLEQAPAGLRCGDELAVQLVKEAQKTKDPVVTTRLSLAGRLVVLTAGRCLIHVSSKISDSAWKAETRKRLSTLFENAAEGKMPAKDPNHPFGFIIRTGAYQASTEEIFEEAAALAEQYAGLCRAAATHACYSRLLQSEPAWLTRLYGLAGEWAAGCGIVTDLPDIYEQCQAFLSGHGMNPLFSLRLYTDAGYPLEKLYRLQTFIEELLDKRVWLKSGGYLVIEPTEAMVVIDVNTGKANGKKTKEETILRLNLEAAAEIARQLRLRNLSGMILIDFIGMKQEAHQEQLMRFLREAVHSDPAGVSVIDITKLGIVECTRRKTTRPVYEQLGTIPGRLFQAGGQAGGGGKKGETTTA